MEDLDARREYLQAVSFAQGQLIALLLLESMKQAIQRSKHLL